MKPFSDSALLLSTYIQADPDLLHGGPISYGIVPEWFRNKNQPPPFPEKKPVYDGPETDKILGRIEDWLSDPCYDLPEPDFFTGAQNKALAAYQAQIEEWRPKKREWAIAQNLILLRKWIYWVSRFSCMDLSDEQVFEFSPSIKDYPKAI